MKNEEVLIYLLLCLLTLLLTVLLESILIPILKRLRAAQPILTVGPSWHLSKKGTPTMGGLAFIVALLFSFLLFCIYARRGGASRAPTAALVVIFATLSGAIGFFDDYQKLVKRENKGLSAWQKYMLQLLLSLLLLVVARKLDLIDTAIFVPFFKKKVQLGVWFYPMALLYLTGVVNALNLTDGLDGLLGSTVAVLSLFFILYGNAVGEGLFLLCGVLLLGACLGFLCFNRHPAKVFMGDTGSLFLGGMVGALGILGQRPLTVLGGGGIFVIEAASVLLQVLYFKITHGKRLFLMAPLHHHFEKKGLQENTIVLLFSACTALFCAIMLWGR
jgi:phospho-N-acetylmuramoyl-pentapeptide-transferase